VALALAAGSARQPGAARVSAEPGPGGRGQGILERVLGHVASDSEHPAVKDPTRALTYGQLRDEIGAVAAGLAARGVGPADRVALHLTNSVDFVVAAFACTSLGAVFIPLAVTDPLRRLEVVLADCSPSLVVTADPDEPGATMPAVATQLPARGDLVAMSALRAGGAAPARLGAPAWDRPIYAIYTSGTTTAPKGVLIGQGAFVAAMTDAIDACGFDGDTRALSVSAVHFDGSFATVFTTLVAGGSLVFVPRDALLFPRTFINAVEREAITHTGFSPTYLRLLLTDPRLSRLAQSSLSMVAVGGEACAGRDVAALLELVPQVRVFNRYGPTETTITVTHHRVTEADTACAVVPIGTPHEGVTFRLLDEHGKLIEAADRVGELYIGGDQLMEGYLGAPALTAEVLRDDFVEGETLYRTGDLVYRDASGNYCYVDRADRVIKRSGVRISLVELTHALRTVRGVAAATCIAFASEEGNTGIVGFVVVDDPSAHAPAPGERGAGAVSATQWIDAAMRQVLPVTMLPDRIEIVDHLPMTSAGKVDEHALLAAAGLHRAGRGGGG
jgi:D-alanine--poly(phosphoribitol) ligase subunit 1